MDEYIILRSGYNQAINDVLEVLDKNIYIDIENKNVLKDMILRRQKSYLNGQNEYEGSLYKYHDAVNKIGYIIFDDIYEIKGVCIYIEDGTYKELDEKELLFIKKAFSSIWSETFKSKDLINLRYKEFLNKWNKI